MKNSLSSIFEASYMPPSKNFSFERYLNKMSRNKFCFARFSRFKIKLLTLAGALFCQARFNLKQQTLAASNVRRNVLQIARGQIKYLENILTYLVLTLFCLETLLQACFV